MRNVRFNWDIGKFKFNFLLRGHLESLSLDKFIFTVFRILPCYGGLFLETFFSPILLVCSAEMILSVISCKPYHRRLSVRGRRPLFGPFMFVNSEGKQPNVPKIQRNYKLSKNNSWCISMIEHIQEILLICLAENGASTVLTHTHFGWARPLYGRWTISGSHQGFHYGFYIIRHPRSVW